MDAEDAGERWNIEIGYSLKYLLVMDSACIFENYETGVKISRCDKDVQYRKVSENVERFPEHNEDNFYMIMSCSGESSANKSEPNLPTCGYFHISLYLPRDAIYRTDEA